MYKECIMYALFNASAKTYCSQKDKVQEIFLKYTTMAVAIDIIVHMDDNNEHKIY